MKKLLSLLTAYMLLGGAFIWAETGITLSVDGMSSYTPTQIVNGDFSAEPYMVFKFEGTKYTTCNHNTPSNDSSESNITVSDIEFNGVDQGWNTTENKPYKGNLFEWRGNQWVASNNDSSKYYYSTGSYIEINCSNAATVYQDLTTTPGDVIRWSFDHGARSNAQATQIMHVEIGAPKRDSSGNIINANGVQENINTNITNESVVKYTTSGITGGGQNLGIAVSLSNLTVARTTNEWKKVEGIYMIPQEQTVTRFCFLSDNTDTPNMGNFMDNVTFSTLIGNLNAYAEWDATVVVTGYWGETDTSKKLIVRVGDTNNLIDMSSESKKNFKIVIAQNVVGDASTVKIYHQDYETAAKTIDIERHYHDGVLYGVWNYSDRLPATGRYALGTDVTLAGDVTLTGDAAMSDKGGAKICLNGHSISGGKVKINSGTNKISIENITGEDTGAVSEGIVVNGGDFTVNGLTLPSLSVTDGTCTVTGLVTISSLSLATGKVLTLGSELNDGSKITLTATPNTGVITSGFGSRNLGSIINLPSTAKTYMLMKTKGGELKVSQHKSGW